MKSRISTTELKSRTSHIERLICWLEKLLIQMLLTLTLWPLKLIYNRPWKPGGFGTPIESCACLTNASADQSGLSIGVR